MPCIPRELISNRQQCRKCQRRFEIAQNRRRKSHTWWGTSLGRQHLLSAFRSAVGGDVIIFGSGESLPEFPMMPHAIAVAPDVDDMTVMEQAVDERRGHHVIAEDPAPLFKALVTG